MLWRALAVVGGSRVPAPAATAVVSSFPPLRDGIARYAGQFADQLAESRRVIRIGTPGSDADHVVRLRGGIRPLRLLIVTTRGHEVVVMWHPEFFLAGGPARRALTYLALGLALRARRAAVIIHELDLPPDPQGGWRRVAAICEGAGRRWLWRSVAEVRCHSRSQLLAFAEAIGDASIVERGVLIAHGAGFKPAVHFERDAARVALSLPREGHLFLCIGFLGRHKGFDRAIEAFRRLGDDTALLYVVGSRLSDHPDIEVYIAELEQAAAASPRVTLSERYVDDTEFDTWLQAADTVLLPYRSSSTSSVVARARLLRTPVIATTVGGFLEEIGPRDRLVDDDAELVAAMRARIREGEGR